MFFSFEHENANGQSQTDDQCEKVENEIRILDRGHLKDVQFGAGKQRCVDWMSDDESGNV